MKLDPHQVVARDRLRTARRFVLADEPGVGKTAPALMAAQLLHPSSVLIVGPGQAQGVWEDEAKEWLGIDVASYVGPRRRDLGQPWMFTNYSLLNEMLPLGWNVVIFDESHKLRNPSRRVKTLYHTVKRYRSKLDTVWFLTGTPFPTGPQDIWTQLNLCDPREWSSYWDFVKRYTDAYQGTFGWIIEGRRNMQEFWDRAEPWMLQRLRKDVSGLPPSRRQMIPLRMTPRQERLYNLIESEMMAEFESGRLVLTPNVIARDMRLRQLLVTPKILDPTEDVGAMLPALAERIVDEQEPVIVFTPFKEAIPYISAALVAAGVDTYRIQGAMAPGALERTVEQWKRSSYSAKALISTIQMGISWNGQDTAATAHFVGFDWSPHFHVQAEGRIERRGQKRFMRFLYWSHRGTIDEHQLDVLHDKATLARVIEQRRYNFTT